MEKTLFIDSRLTKPSPLRILTPQSTCLLCLYPTAASMAIADAGDTASKKLSLEIMETCYLFDGFGFVSFRVTFSAY